MNADKSFREQVEETVGKLTPKERTRFLKVVRFVEHASDTFSEWDYEDVVWAIGMLLANGPIEALEDINLYVEKIQALEEAISDRGTN